MKKIGITCDDYKVDKFMKALTKAGYNPINAGQLTPGVIVLQIEVKEEDFKKEVTNIGNITTRLQELFARRN